MDAEIEQVKEFPAHPTQHNVNGNGSMDSMASMASMESLGSLGSTGFDCGFAFGEKTPSCRRHRFGRFAMGDNFKPVHTENAAKQKIHRFSKTFTFSV